MKDGLLARLDQNPWIRHDIRRVLLHVEASLNEGALTLVNAGQPCLRIIFDLKAELQKKKADWRLELGLGALQAFGLGGQVRVRVSLGSA